MRWLRVVGALRTDYLSFDVDGNQQGVRQFWTLSPKATIIASPLREGRLDLFVNFGMGFHSNPAEVALEDGQRSADGTFVLRAVPKFYGGEVGARTHLFDRVDVAAAFWLSYLENETVFDADAGGFVPAAPTRRLGFDLEASARILPWLSADLELAQASSTAMPDGGNGGAVALAPKLYMTGGVTVAHRRTGVRGGLRFRYLADRPAFDEASAEYQQLIATAPDRVVARGWFIVDAYVAWRWRFFEAQAAVQNLLNATWREAQFGNSSCTRAESADPTNAACSAALPPEMRAGIADVHFTPGVPFNLQLTAKAYF